jgi:hypothetical protein
MLVPAVSLYPRFAVAELVNVEQIETCCRFDGNKVRRTNAVSCKQTETWTVSIFQLFNQNLSYIIDMCEQHSWAHEEEHEHIGIIWQVQTGP